MDKIIGKIVGLAFFCLFFVCIAAEIGLSVRDMDGNALSQAGIGQPFKLEVTITGSGNVNQLPVIAGLDHFQVRRTGVRMSTINGKSTTRYTYKLQADRPGTYKIGPAVVRANGSTMQSNLLSMVVSDEAVSKKITTKSREQSKQAFLALSTDKQRVVMGEQLRCYLRFYYTDDAIILKKLGQPEQVSALAKDLQGPYTGSEKRNGTHYQYAEWQWNIFPNQSGNMVIPAHSADYEIPREEDNFWGGFRTLLKSPVDHRRVYSNALQVQVDDLPPSNDQVHAVGKFERMQSNLKPAVVKQGEAMVLSIDIEGQGNLETIAVPVLQNIPEALKYYESKHSISKPTQSGQLPVKHFEFIVQGLKEGEWEIPKQTFVYFDVDEKKYKKLETVPLVATIVSAPAGIHIAGTRHKNIDTHDQNQNDDLGSLDKDGLWYCMPKRKPIVFWLFTLLILLPVFAACYPIAIGRIGRYYQQKEPIFRYKRAFKTARAQLERARILHEQKQVYHIFITLISSRCQVPIAEVSQEFIQKRLRDIKMSEQMYAQWEDFFGQLTHYTFGNEQTKHTVDTAFFENAKQWIDILEKSL